LLRGGFALGAAAAAVVHSRVPAKVAVHVPAGLLLLETGRFAGRLEKPPLNRLWVSGSAWLDPAYELFEDRGLLASRLAVA